MPGQLEAFGAFQLGALNRRSPEPSFEALLGPRAWARLSPLIRARFSAGTSVADFIGAAQLIANPFGKFIACAMLPFGRPLPTRTGVCEAKVSIRPGPHGAVWDRAYRKAGQAWQHVRSVKRQLGSTLYECAGPIWMRLRLEERNRALAFVSTGFFLNLGPMRLRLPDWLTPGALEVVHTDHGNGAFAFTLTCDHPLFGRIFDQVVDLTDVTHKELQPLRSTCFSPQALRLVLPRCSPCSPFRSC